MGLGAPYATSEEMQNYKLCQAIITSGGLIKDGITIAANEIAAANKEIASKNREANYSNAKMMADAILSGSSYVERGMLHIASELKRSNTLTERRDLEGKIRTTEDWLFEKGFLKDFYQTAKLGEEIIPFVNERYVYFLDSICYMHLTENEKNKIKSGCSKEEFQGKLKEAKDCLCRFALNRMCHPLVLIAYLISKNGLISEGAKGFRIGRMSYNWYPDCQNCKCVSKDGKQIYDYGEYQIVFEKLNGTFIAEMTFEDALRHVIQVATNFEELYGEELNIRLEWEAFFAELNMNIALYNLRVLAQSLETFKRQKQLELLA